MPLEASEACPQGIRREVWPDLSWEQHISNLSHRLLCHPEKPPQLGRRSRLRGSLTTVPRLSTTNPLPEQLPLRPVTLMRTTEGSTFSIRSAKAVESVSRCAGATDEGDFSPADDSTC